MLGSVAEGVVAGRAYESYRWLVVTSDDGDVIGAALRTAPYPALLSPMPASAASAVGRLLAEVEPDLPGLTGPRDTVMAAVSAAGWEHRVRVAMDEYLRVLGTYTPPSTPASGSPRRSRLADLDLLVPWHERFVADAKLLVPVTEDRVRHVIEVGSLWLWEDDGRPVAMAGHAPLVSTPGGVVGRIGPVFTPAALRGRGYGTAITGAVVEVLLPQCTTIMLVADAANPASNSVYARLGFVIAAELVEVALDQA